MVSSFFYLFISGLLGGFIAGLVGIGGGVIYIFFIPFALHYLGVPLAEIPQYTIANSFFAILFASMSANYVLYKKNLFFIKEVLTVGLFAIVSSIITLKFIVNTAWYSIEIFNAVVIVLLIYMLFSTLVSAKKAFISDLGALQTWALGLVGAAGGFIAALSGLGGGIVIIPMLNSLMKVDIKEASSISSGVIMLSAMFITLANLMEEPLYPFRFYNSGYIIFPISLAISLGVIIASPFGVKVSRKLSSTSISYIYASILGIVIIKKLIELLKIVM
jgi:uncharacterized membrane protein YfcA